MVADICDFSYVGGIDRRITNLRLALDKNGPYLRKY
jgi:hypothetical protein